MKSYFFDILKKSERIKTNKNDLEFDFSEYREFNQYTYGFKRSWKILYAHNDISAVKRIINPASNLMLSSFKETEKSTLNYMIYIDFGKYESNRKMLTFYDLELDIIILKDLSYQILDMDELIEAFENRRITQSELNTVLMVLQKTVNSFNSRGVFKTLEDIYGQASIQWLLEG
ncbi:MAG TPA: DUF402 domain-containing protein [Petrotogaceae bacterium]|mgnify:CR=1 FL=1|jgi:hypothetical protein|nr:DUF402 domain-containing protein [Petrotogaceae bacterium]HQF32461.1 DUF402 domain-containing protein [Petrotogaceae bacterium]HQH32778.1 DUF402 domain-containing protein [Petrotogaceae bacterium]HQI78110.1 DUF402 domain-containing protein [Petrotogaceae bacterium]